MRVTARGGEVWTMRMLLLSPGTSDVDGRTRTTETRIASTPQLDHATIQSDAEVSKRRSVDTIDETV